MKRLALLCLLAMTAGCATVSKPEKITVPTSNAPVVSPVLEQEQARFVKRKVAIARFSNETSSAQSFLVDRSSNDRLGKQASDILSASLTETGKFILLERIDGDKLDFKFLTQLGLHSFQKGFRQHTHSPNSVFEWNYTTPGRIFPPESSAQQKKLTVILHGFYN